jgi:hypothetical protein
MQVFIETQVHKKRVIFEKGVRELVEIIDRS